MTDENRDPAASLGSVDERELPWIGSDAHIARVIAQAEAAWAAEETMPDGEGFMCEGLSDIHLARLQQERRDAGFGDDEII
jgi:hypothetical protein